MSEKESFDIPEEYYYSKDHEWLKLNPNGNARVGITDYAAKMLNDIVYVTLPQENQKFSKKDVFGQVESVKTVSDVYMPISGIVVKSNLELTRKPEVVASSPYGDGWMLEIKPTNYDAESKVLLDAKSYREYIQQLQQENH